MNRSIMLAIVPFIAMFNAAGMEIDRFNGVEYANRVSQVSRIDTIANMAHSGIGKTLVSEKELPKPELFNEVDESVVSVLTPYSPGRSATPFEKFTVLYTEAKKQTDELIPKVEDSTQKLKDETKQGREKLSETLKKLEAAQRVVGQLIALKDTEMAELRAIDQKYATMVKLGTSIKALQRKENLAAKHALQSLNTDIKELQKELKSRKAERKLLIEEKLDDKGHKQLSDVENIIATHEETIAQLQKEAREIKEKLPTMLKPTEKPKSWLPSLFGS